MTPQAPAKDACALLRTRLKAWLWFPSVTHFTTKLAPCPNNFPAKELCVNAAFLLIFLSPNPVVSVQRFCQHYSSQYDSPSSLSALSYIPHALLFFCSARDIFGRKLCHLLNHLSFQCAKSCICCFVFFNLLRVFRTVIDFLSKLFVFTINFPCL